MTGLHMLVMTLAASAITWTVMHVDTAVMYLEYFGRSLLPF